MFEIIWKKTKSTINNSKLTMVSQSHAIIASFNIIINNCDTLFLYKLTENFEKLEIFTNMCHNILIKNQEIYAL